MEIKFEKLVSKSTFSRGFWQKSNKFPQQETNTNLSAQKPSFSGNNRTIKKVPLQPRF